jgi:hypothetical protein
VQSLFDCDGIHGTIRNRVFSNFQSSNEVARFISHVGIEKLQGLRDLSSSHCVLNRQYGSPAVAV